MSHHVLHVLQPYCTLGKEHGFIVCRSKGQPDKKLPHADIRAVIIAARGVCLTSAFLSAILEGDAVVLHCDEQFRPCGVTVPLARTVDRTALLRQASRPKRLNERLWRCLLRAKVANQQAVLSAHDKPCGHLAYALEHDTIDEANCARRYWERYFPAIGWLSTGRDQRDSAPPNQMLNYGYAVLAALCHRSILVHGLSPLLGVKHTTRYRTHPLVYDLMEPFRPAVDLMLAEFMDGADIAFSVWARKVGENLRDKRIRRTRYSLKLMDAIDVCASSLAQAYAQNSANALWVPEI